MIVTFRVLPILSCLMLISCTNSRKCQCSRNPYVPVGAGFSIIITNNSQEILKFDCQKGFYLIGNSELTCGLDCRWNGEYPRCAVDVLEHHWHKIVRSSHGERFNDGCLRTEKSDTKPWMKIELMEPVEVLGIHLALQDDIPNSIEVRVGNDTDHRQNPMCHWVHRRELEKTRLKLTIPECPVAGSIISLSSVNAKSSLSLCNIKVLSKPDKILHKSFCFPNKVSETIEKSTTTIGRKCVFYDHEQKANFTEAKSRCARLDMDLLTNAGDDSTYSRIQNHLEESLRLDERRRQLVWLGIRKDPTDRNWHYETHLNESEKRFVTSLPWGLGEPGGEDCAVIDSALRWRWNSVRCVIYANFICIGLPKQCPRPDVPLNHKAIFREPKEVVASDEIDFKDTFPVGHRTSFSCIDEPSTDIIMETRMCQTDGRWSDPRCDLEGASRNESIISQGHEEGSKSITSLEYGKETSTEMNLLSLATSTTSSVTTTNTSSTSAVTTSTISTSSTGTSSTSDLTSTSSSTTITSSSSASSPALPPQPVVNPSRAAGNVNASLNEVGHGSHSDDAGLHLRNGHSLEKEDHSLTEKDSYELDQFGNREDNGQGAFIVSSKGYHELVKLISSICVIIII